MNTEEILLKLGLDGTSFAQGIRSVKGQIQEFSQTGHSGFVHVGNGAREFHRLLHGITESSPLLGTALRLAISPVTAALAAAVLVFQHFNRQIEESNKLLDEMARLNARPIGDVEEAAHKAALEMEKLNIEFKKWLDSHDRPMEKISEELDYQIQALQHQATVQENLLRQKKEMGQITEGQFAAGMQGAQRNFLQAKAKAEGDALLQASDAQMRAKAAAVQWERIAANPFTQDKLEKARQLVEHDKAELTRLTEKRATAAEHEATSREGNIFAKLDDWVKGKKSLAELEKDTADADDAVRKLVKNLNEATKTYEQLRVVNDTAHEKMKRAEADYDEAHRAFKNLSKQVETTRVRLNELETKRVPPAFQDRSTVDELARSGQWLHFRSGNRPDIFQQGPAAAIAQRIQFLESLAHNANIWANFGLRDAARKEADTLRSQLGQTGILRPDEYMASMDRHLQDLADLANGRGGSAVQVNVTLTP